MSLQLIPGFGAFTPAASGVLDGTESDGTNLFPDDASFGPSFDWDGVSVTFTRDAVTAPDGGTNAATVVENSSNDRHIIYYKAGGFTITTDGTFDFSIYAKYVDRRYLQLMVANGDGTSSKASTYFDLVGGSVTDADLIGSAQTATGTIQATPSGFYKCTMRFRLAANVTSAYFHFSMSDVSTYGAPLAFDCPQYTGDGASSVVLWRPKLVLI